MKLSINLTIFQDYCCELDVENFDINDAALMDKIKKEICNLSLSCFDEIDTTRQYEIIDENGNDVTGYIQP